MTNFPESAHSERTETDLTPGHEESAAPHLEPDTSPATVEPWHAPQSPARYSGRIRGLDLARGLAILGMIWAHVKPMIAEDGFVYLLSEIPAGRSSALFALLAGVSIAILTGRNVAYTGERMRHAQLRIVGRAIMLFAFAALLGVFATPIAVILDFYALWFILSIPLVHWSARRLTIAAIAVALVGPQLINSLNWFLSEYELWGDGFLTNNLVYGMYPGLAYMAYVLAGMALGRLDLTDSLLRTQLLIIGTALAVLGYGTAWVATNSFAAASYEGQVAYDFAGFPMTLFDFFTAAPHSNTTPEVIGNLGVGLAVIGACLWLAPAAKHVLYPLAAVGSMSLTAYVGHALFLHFKQDWFFGDSVTPFLWVAGGVLAFCTIWALLPPRRGPLEWLTWKFSQWFARPVPPSPESATPQPVPPAPRQEVLDAR